MPERSCKLYYWYTCNGKNSIYKVWYYKWFQVSTGGLQTYPFWIWGNYNQCFLKYLTVWLHYFFLIFLNVVNYIDFGKCWTYILETNCITVCYVIWYAMFDYVCLKLYLYEKHWYTIFLFQCICHALVSMLYVVI